MLSIKETLQLKLNGNATTDSLFKHFKHVSCFFSARFNSVYDVINATWAFKDYHLMIFQKLLHFHKISLLKN